MLCVRAMCAWSASQINVEVLVWMLVVICVSYIRKYMYERYRRLLLNNIQLSVDAVFDQAYTRRSSYKL